ncbi:MAG TPA: hypothetical protein VN800_00195 [Candidatus Acidoferrales bacterium]|nr:hypothetical protein [Candidatus Acidoferrales bacterium]
MSRLLRGASTPDADRGGREIVDPAEAWESPVPGSTVSRVPPSARMAGFLAPTSDADLPAGVLRTLRFVCGSLPVDRCLVLPASTRPIDRSCRRYVTGDRQVLGFGERATGLWVDGRGRDPVAVVQVDRIGAIEDLAVLSYRRLSVRAADVRLSVRYAAHSRPLLAAPLAWLRRRIEGEARGEVPWLGLRTVGTGAVPEEWRAVADDVARVGGEPGVAMLFGLVPERLGEGRARGVLVAVTSAELVVLAESDGTTIRTGAWPQALVVPRRTLQQAREGGDRLLLRSAGVDRVLRLGPQLAAAAVELIDCAGPARRVIRSAG